MEPFACPHCRFILIFPDHYAGKSMNCPRCQRKIQVPGGPKHDPDPPSEDSPDNKS